jgi:2',3'-cyclic-nucleotide 2'-phosphodiesterase (5'-nucleotidase family)
MCIRDRFIQIREINNIKVGFIGICLPETAQLYAAQCKRKVIFSPILEATTKGIKLLEKEGVDVIIALTHLPFIHDKLLAKRFPSIKVIVGAHDHIPMAFYENKTLIFKSGSDAEFLGRIDLIIEKKEEILDSKTLNKVEIFPSWSTIGN